MSTIDYFFCVNLAERSVSVEQEELVSVSNSLKSNVADQKPRLSEQSFDTLSKSLAESPKTAAGIES